MGLDAGSSSYLKQYEHGHRAQYSGSAPGIATGTFIAYGTSQQAVCANAHSGEAAQIPAVGFALMGQNWGSWTVKAAEHFDIVDDPMGVGQVNSGTYAIGLPLWLSGTGLSNFSATPPDGHGCIIQQLGVFINDPNSGITGQSRRFRIKIGTPFIQSGVGLGSTLRPYRGQGLA